MAELSSLVAATGHRRESDKLLILFGRFCSNSTPIDEANAMKSMNLTKRTFLALAGLAGILGTNSVRAESTITWQSPQNITSYTDVANAANAFMGYDLNPTPETVNGVAFSSATPTGFTTNFNNYQATSSSSGRYQTLSSSLSNASYAAILAYGATILSPPGTGIYVSESGLTQGVTTRVPRRRTARFSAPHPPPRRIIPVRFPITRARPLRLAVSASM